MNGLANADSFIASDVSYSQQELMIVTGVEHSGSTVTFTGTGFLTDHLGRCEIESVKSDSVIVLSATQAIADFSLSGIPATTKVP